MEKAVRGIPVYTVIAAHLFLTLIDPRWCIEQILDLNACVLGALRQQRPSTTLLLFLSKDTGKARRGTFSFPNERRGRQVEIGTGGVRLRSDGNHYHL